MNKSEERWYVEEFFKALGINPIHLLEGEAPDFFAFLGSKWIAIEMTKFQAVDGNPVSKRQLEAEWHSLSAAITDERDNSSRCKNVHAFLGFRDGPLPSKSDRKDFIRELLSFVEAQNMLPDKMGRDSTYHNMKGYPFLERFLRLLALNRSRAFVDWGSNITGGSVGLTEEDLFSTMKDKLVTDRPSLGDLKSRLANEKLSPRLAGAISENWLLIHTTEHISQTVGKIQLESLHSFQTLHEKIRKSCFDKAYIFDLWWKQLCVWKDGVWTAVL